MCVYNTILDNHNKKTKVLKEKLEKKTRECEQLKTELFEFKRQAFLNSPASEQRETQICNNRLGSDDKVLEFDTLRNENQKLINKITQLEAQIKKNAQSDNAEFILLKIPYFEKFLFKNEIEDYLYSILYYSIECELKKFPKDKKDERFRKFDVLSALLKSKTFNWQKTETNKNLSKINSILNNHKSNNLSNLQTCGFTKKENCHNHLKLYFHDERYQVTFSLSPSDGNASKQQMREIKNRCFLMPNQK